MRTSASSSLGRSGGRNPYISSQTPIRMDETKRSSSSAVLTQRIPSLPDAEITSDRLCGAFDQIVIASQNWPTQKAIEQVLSNLFDATVIVFLNSESSRRLYSPTISQFCRYDQGIIGCNCFGEVVVISNPFSEAKFDPLVDRRKPTMLIPLKSDEGVLKAIVQIGKEKDFTSSDIALGRAFATKFSFYSHLLMPDESAFTVQGQFVDTDGQDAKEVLGRFASRLRRQFICRTVEFWCYTSFDNSVMKFVPKDNLFREFENGGIVASALQSGLVVNVPNVLEHPDYNESMDGKEKDSLLVVPLPADNKIFGVALRGKENAATFSAVDEQQISQIAPLIGRYFSNTGGDESSESSTFAERLKALLDVAEIISGVMDVEVLVPTIMERACSLLATERCSVFLVDAVRKELVTSFQGGLEKKIRIPLNRGIVGHTATTGQVVNITDAYSDPRFDKAVDMATGYRTRTILTVPIYNNRGEIAGVTEMINRSDGKAFDDEDIRVLMAFNVFCGISLDNSKMYQVSLDLTRQLRGFVEMSAVMNEPKQVKDVLEEILNNAMVVVHASRGTIFLRDAELEDLSPFITCGNCDKIDRKCASQVIKTRKAAIFAGGHEITEEVVASSANLSRTSSVLLSSQTDVSLNSARACLDDDTTEEHVCDFPLLTSDTKVLGVMELVCNYKILPEDLKLLDCFAVFASVSLERSELEEIAQLGHIETKLKQYIAADERTSYVIPAKLKIPDDHASTIFRINFDAPAWDGIGHFKVLWMIMDTFHLFEEYKISNEKFFHFISEISQTYNKVPYHNWRHAVDVCQFVTYELKTTHFDENLTKFNLFALIVAAICHDANHDGFTNVYNVKAETPLGILFKNQSVMETHHCTVAIDVMAKEECNLFSELSGEDFKKMWTLIIQMILVTDMAKHFDFLKDINAKCDAGPVDRNDPDTQLMMMKAILKCADISNVSRPFELADKWCDVLCEEFFRQGDLEMAHGMEYTSPLNDREHLDKPKSQIGFYTFVCLPLYQAAARLFPELQVNVDQVQSNLAVWKQQQEKKSAAQNAQ